MSYPAVTPAPTTPPARGHRTLDVPGLVAIIISAIALLPALIIFLIGALPTDARMIWWVGLWLAPVLSVVGVAVLALGVAGIVVAARRGTRFVLSIIGLVLAVVLIVPGVVVLLTVWWA